MIKPRNSVLVNPFMIRVRDNLQMRVWMLTLSRFTTKNCRTSQSKELSTQMKKQVSSVSILQRNEIVEIVDSQVKNHTKIHIILNTTMPQILKR